MGVKVRFVEERWVKSNGTTEKVKLETPYWAVMVDYKEKRKFLKVEGGKKKAEARAKEIENGLVDGEWADDENDSGAVRDLLGHAELTTTNIYAHSVSDAREIVGRLENVGKSANPRKQESVADGGVTVKTSVSPSP